ncbi:MAG: proteasome subunit alpha [Jatrophihabitans sp.]
MSMPFYASAEQIMRDRSEYARKGIARGRSVAVLSYTGGILFVAENASASLHKVSEIYDRIGFAAVGRYPEFENLRVAGIQHADLRGFSYDRRDVTARSLTNAYAQTLGAIFTEQQKPYEVELCVAEVGLDPAGDQLYRITYDGTIVDEPHFLVMGGQVEALTTSMRDTFRPGESLAEAVEMAVRALGSVGGENGAPRQLDAAQLEVAVLDRAKEGRAFRRLAGAALEELLPPPAADKSDDAKDADAKDPDATDPDPAEDDADSASADGDGPADPDTA